MRVVVPSETRTGEKRVALLPDIISKLTRAGLSVAVQSQAGIHAGANDAAYTEAGATVFSSSQLTSELGSADVVLSVQPLTPALMGNLKRGAITISFLSPTSANDSIDAAVKSGVTAFSLEAVPRISQIGRAHV